jgi:drug/metabolite transporter (DMT)-like permease
MGIIAAVISALSYGIGSTLQAVAARSEPDVGGVDARLLVRLAKRWRFVVGLGLDVVGFIAQFIALRTLAVFVVQAVQAGNLAVTAVAAIPLLSVRLKGREWAAVVAVCVGLTLLAAAAGSEGVDPVRMAVKWWFLGAAAAVAVGGYAAGQVKGRAAPPVLGLFAGLGFGVVALAARVITSLSVGSMLTNPATYALLVAGFASFLFYATGLQRGTVTTVTAAVVVAETLVPSLVGVIVLGDGTRPGLVWLAVLGFVVAIAGALMLARFGELAPEDEGLRPRCRGAGDVPSDVRHVLGDLPAGGILEGMKLKLDLHEIFNRGRDIDRALRDIMDEAVAKKATLVEIIPGKGSGALKKHVLKFLDQKDIKAMYHRVEKDSKNFGRVFVHFRHK